MPDSVLYSTFCFRCTHCTAKMQCNFRPYVRASNLQPPITLCIPVVTQKELPLPTFYLTLIYSESEFQTPNYGTNITFAQNNSLEGICKIHQNVEWSSNGIFQLRRNCCHFFDINFLKSTVDGLHVFAIQYSVPKV